VCLVESSTEESQTSSSRLSDACAQYLTGEGLGKFALFFIFIHSLSKCTNLSGVFSPLQYFSIFHYESTVERKHRETLIRLLLFTINQNQIKPV